jgi:anti-anti-sigma regulatory factor
MNIMVENLVAGVPVTVVRLEGELDASNYQEFIARADSLYRDGIRHVLIDLTDLSFLSSSGLVALHSVALTMRGETPPDPAAGWDVFHTMSHDLEAQPGPQDNIKLVNPQPRVARTLEISGFSRLLPIFSDREAALASFAQG